MKKHSAIDPRGYFSKRLTLVRVSNLSRIKIRALDLLRSRFTPRLISRLSDDDEVSSSRRGRPSSTSESSSRRARSRPSDRPDEFALAVDAMSDAAPRARHRDGPYGRRTRILIFALAMFRVRPGVNWMLIAVGSWPYIRGTLSPSPPGARRSGAPSRIPPRYTSLFSHDDDDGPTVRAATTPLWDRRPTPPPHPPHTHARVAETSLSFFNSRARARARRGPPRSLPRARDVSLCSFFFFLSLTYLRRYLDCASALCDTFSGERRTYRLARSRGFP